MRRVRGLIHACVLVALLLGTATAAAQPASDAPSAEEAKLSDARAALEQRRYPVARDLAAPLRKSTAAATRAEALEIVAIASLSAGRTAEGEEALRELYALQPGFELVDTSLPEEVQRAFQAEASRPHPRNVSLRMATPRASTPSVEITTDRPVEAVRLACRVEAGLAFAPLPTTGSGTSFRAELKSARPHACFAVALDGDGLLVGRQGTRARPIDVRPPARAVTAAGGSEPLAATTPPADSRPLTERWWFWTALGAVAVVGTVTIIVAVAASGDDGPSEKVDTTRPTLFRF